MKVVSPQTAVFGGQRSTDYRPPPFRVDSLYRKLSVLRRQTSEVVSPLSLSKISIVFLFYGFKCNHQLLSCHPSSLISFPFRSFSFSFRFSFSPHIPHPSSSLFLLPTTNYQLSLYFHRLSSHQSPL